MYSNASVPLIVCVIGQVRISLTVEEEHTVVLNLSFYFSISLLYTLYVTFCFLHKLVLIHFASLFLRSY